MPHFCLRIYCHVCSEPLLRPLSILHRAPLVWLLLAALAVRLGAAVWWENRVAPGHRFEFGDSESYWRLAQTIVGGEPTQGSTAMAQPMRKIFCTPGYPLLLAALFSVVGSDPPVLWARGLSALLGTCAVAGVYWLARVCFDPTTGLIAAALTAFYPGGIGMSVYVLERVSRRSVPGRMLAEASGLRIAGKRSLGNVGRSRWPDRWARASPPDWPRSCVRVGSCLRRWRRALVVRSRYCSPRRAIQRLALCCCCWRWRRS